MRRLVYFALVVLACHGCGSEMGESARDGRPIPFDRELWLTSVPKAGESCLRDRMVDDLKAMMVKGVRLVDVLDQLGTPDSVRSSKDDHTPNHAMKVRRDEVIVCYNVTISSDNWPEQLQFYFDPQGKLTKLKVDMA